MTTASIYLRISEDRTHEQLAPERQLSEIKAHLERLGIEPGEVFMDVESASKPTVVRKDFQRLMASKPEAIATWHSDRLARLTKDLEQVIALEVNVYAVVAGHLDLSTPAGRAVARTVTAWSTYEGEQKALRQIAQNKQAAYMGKPIWRRVPFGFQMDGSHEPEEAAAIRQAYLDYLDGSASMSMIAKRWTAAGFKSGFEKKYGEWTVSGIKKVFLHPRNAGISVYKGEEVATATWEPIVDEETFRAVVRKVTTNAKRYNGGRTGRPAQSLLTGIARCGKCDSPLARSRFTKGGPAYKCPRKACIGIVEHKLDDAVGVLVLAYLCSDEAARLWSTPVDNAAVMRARTAMLAAEREHAALIQAFQDKTISLVAFATVEPSLIQAADKARAEYESLSGSPTKALGVENPEQLIEQWRGGDMPLERRRMVLRTLFSRIVMMPRDGRSTFDPRRDLQWEWATTPGLVRGAAEAPEPSAGSALAAG